MKCLSRNLYFRSSKQFLIKNIKSSKNMKEKHVFEIYIVFFIQKNQEFVLV